MSSWDCRAANEVINYEDKHDSDVWWKPNDSRCCFILVLLILTFFLEVAYQQELKRAMHHASLGIIAEYWTYAIGVASQWQDENGLHDKRIEK